MEWLLNDLLQGRFSYPQLSTSVNLLPSCSEIGLTTRSESISAIFHFHSYYIKFEQCMKNLQQRQLHREGAGGSIHSQDQLHSFVGLHKSLGFGDLHVGPHCETVCLAGLSQGEVGLYQLSIFWNQIRPSGWKYKGWTQELTPNLKPDFKAQLFTFLLSSLF